MKKTKFFLIGMAAWLTACGTGESEYDASGIFIVPTRWYIEVARKLMIQGVDARSLPKRLSSCLCRESS